MAKFSGPDDQLFVRYKRYFDEVNQDNLFLWEWPADTTWPPFHGPDNRLVAHAKDVRKWLENHCVSGTFPREDYRELCELYTHFLGGEVRKFSFIG